MLVLESVKSDDSVVIVEVVKLAATEVESELVDEVVTVVLVVDVDDVVVDVVDVVVVSI